MSELAAITAARIGGKPVSLQALIHAMKITDRLADFRHAADDLMIQQAAEREGIAPSDAELQAEADALRVAMGLHKAAETKAWLNEKGMSADDFETYVLRLVSARKLKEKLTAGNVDAYFMEHRPGFDAARISRLAFGNEAAAREALSKLTAGTEKLAALADRFPANAGSMPTDAAGFALRLHMNPDMAAAVFRATPGQWVGPIRSGGAFELVQVHELRRAELTERMASLVKDLLFGVWLRGERERTKIEVLVAGLAPSA